MSHNSNARYTRLAQQVSPAGSCLPLALYFAIIEVSVLIQVIICSFGNILRMHLGATRGSFLYKKRGAMWRHVL